MNSNHELKDFLLSTEVMSFLQDKLKLPIIATQKDYSYPRGCTGCGGCCDDDCAAGNTVG